MPMVEYSHRPDPVITLSLPLTCVLVVSCVQMKFDARKMMHALFLPVLIGLCFHSYVFRYVGSILIVWYLVDRFFFTTKQ